MPRILQSEIHSNFSLDTGVWNNYKTGIIDLYNNIQNKEDFNDHLIREYNRKIDRLNQPTGLFIGPYDAGFRYIGN
jgi:hypothetical protein